MPVMSSLAWGLTIAMSISRILVESALDTASYAAKMSPSVPQTKGLSEIYCVIAHRSAIVTKETFRQQAGFQPTPPELYIENTAYTDFF